MPIQIGRLRCLSNPTIFPPHSPLAIPRWMRKGVKTTSSTTCSLMRVTPAAPSLGYRICASLRLRVTWSIATLSPSHQYPAIDYEGLDEAFLERTDKGPLKFRSFDGEPNRFRAYSSNHSSCLSPMRSCSSRRQCSLDLWRRMHSPQWSGSPLFKIWG